MARFKNIETGEEVPDTPPAPSIKQQEVLPAGWTTKGGVYFNERGVPVGEMGIAQPLIDPVDVVASVGSVGVKVGVAAGKYALTTATESLSSKIAQGAIRDGVRRVGGAAVDLGKKAVVAAAPHYYGNADRLNGIYDFGSGYFDKMVGGSPLQQAGGATSFVVDKFRQWKAGQK